MITSPCPRPCVNENCISFEKRKPTNEKEKKQKQKQAKTVATTTQTWKHPSTNRSGIARTTNQRRKRERKKKQNNNNKSNNNKLKWNKIT